MKFDLDYTFSALFAFGILIIAQDWEPRYEPLGYYTAGALLLRANVASIVTAIKERKPE